MSKTKTREATKDLVPREELEAAIEGRSLLQSALDWCGENHALVCWGVKGSGKNFVRLRVEDLQVESEYADPIEGFFGAIDQMKARQSRRKVNLGL